MANWNDIGQSGDVEDRRGTFGGGGAAVGGISLTGLILFVGLNYLINGQSPIESLIQLTGGATSGPVQKKEQPAEFAGNDQYEQFARSVVGSTNATWARQFKATGDTYQKPTLVLFRQATQSGCGMSTSAVGPHYCPADSKIYLDETFFDELVRLGGSNSSVAQAYVIAHEVGHHVQNQRGELDARTNEDSIRVELMADCYAGVWAHDVRGQGVLEPTEIEDAIAAAEAVGDDRVQKATTGYVRPESWTHGSSAQRKAAFMAGYNSGDAQVCRQ